MISVVYYTGNGITCMRNTTYVNGYTQDYVNCTIDPTTSGYTTESFLTAYQCTTMLLSVAGSFLITVPPVLGGEQVYIGEEYVVVGDLGTP